MSIRVFRGSFVSSLVSVAASIIFDSVTPRVAALRYKSGSFAKIDHIAGRIFHYVTCDYVAGGVVDFDRASRA